MPWPKGTPFSMEHKAKLSNHGKGKKHSFHHRLMSEENKKKIGDRLRGRINNPNSTAKSTGRGRAKRLFPCPKGYERHHIDGNELNNDPTNILIVKKRDHMALDGRLNKNLHHEGETDISNTE